MLRSILNVYPGPQKLPRTYKKQHIYYLLSPPTRVSTTSSYAYELVLGVLSTYTVYAYG